MSISSSFQSFSLPELFRLIEADSKSGRLIVQVSQSDRTTKLKGIYYVWFQEGYLVAVSDRLNHKGLISLIEARGWLSPAVVSRLRTLCPPEVPLGIYLQKMKLLNKEKLSLIFQLQLHQVYQLFNLESGQFRFDELSELKDRILTIPWLEMTGQKIKPVEACMYALRLLEKWDIFKEQLPEPHWSLKRSVEPSHLRLTALERQIWELADGNTSLVQISEAIGQPLKDIQVTAFRMAAVGLVKEIFVSSQNWRQLEELVTRSNLDLLSTSSSTESDNLPSKANLLQFLKNKFLEKY